MNVVQTLQQPSLGRFDNSLKYIVTRFQFSLNTLEALPTWLQGLLPRPIPGTYPTAVPEEEDSATPKYFIGRAKEPVEKISLRGLREIFLEQGFSPHILKVYVAKVRDGRPKFALKIRWCRPELTGDDESSFEQTSRYLEVFQELQGQYAWSVRGMVFPANDRGIVLDFRDKVILAPSLRRGKLGVESNQLCIL